MGDDESTTDPPSDAPSDAGPADATGSAGSDDQPPVSSGPPDDESAGGDAASDESPVDESETIAGIPRRTFIRALIVAALGIPVAVESRTLYGMITQRVFGGEGTDGTATASPDEGLTVGDEVLPETPTTERLARAEVRASDSDWTFVLAVDVENPTDAPYEFRLTGVETTDGSIATDSSSGVIAAGGSGTLTAAVPIPQGTTPTGISVVGITDPDGDAERVTADVNLANVPVKRQS